jgi:hypothetical protein
MNLFFVKNTPKVEATLGFAPCPPHESSILKPCPPSI